MMAWKDETLLEGEARELEGTAHWRSEKAAQYSDDRRNDEAARLLLKLAEQLRALEGTPKAAAFKAFHDFIFDGGDAESPIEVVRQWGEYRSRIGFDRFPDNAEAYFDDLMELARDAA